MADSFPFLLGARGVDAEDPLSLAGRGASLANLLTRAQLGQLALTTGQQTADLWADPSMGPLLRQILGMGAGGAGGTAAGPDADAVAAMQQRYGKAIPGVVGSAITMGEKRAAMEKDVAQAREAEQKAHDAAMTDVKQTADAFNYRPSLGQYAALRFKVRRYGLEDEFPPLPDPLHSDLTDVASAVQRISATTPETRAQIQERLASAGKQTTETGLLEPKFKLEQEEQARRWADFYSGKAEFNADAGTWTVVRPAVDAQGKPTRQVVWAGTSATSKPAEQPAAPPGVNINVKGASPTEARAMATDILGGSPATAATATTPPVPTDRTGAPKTGPDVTEKENLKIGGDEMKNIVAQSVKAATLKEMVLDLRAQEHKGGLYSGGIMGTEFTRNLANVLAPLLSETQRNIIGSTQAWTAGKGALVAQAIQSFGGVRVAGPEIQFFQRLKPEELNTAKGREEIYANLFSLADKMQQVAKQAAEYRATPGADQTLASFQPKFTQPKIPPVELGELPDASVWANTSRNNKLRADDGRMLEVRRIRGVWTWVDSKTGTPEGLPVFGQK